MEKPVFIVGANRSGTTLLRLILNAHSQIAIPEEVLYFRSRIGAIPIEQWNAEVPERHYKKIVEDFVSRVEIPDLAHDDVIQYIMEMPHDLRSPYKGLMDFWARSQGKSRWGEKTPGNLFYADVINEMFPDSLFIHMVRDPRAGVYSMERVWFFPEDVIFNALSRHKHMTVGRTTLESSVPPERILTLRYEDLVADPVPVVRRVCEFVGIAFEEKMMSYHRGAGKHMRSDAAADFNEAATKPITTGKNEAWKDGLSKSDVAAIEFICKDEMEEFGYEPVSRATGPVTRALVAVKTAYWKRQEVKNSDNRHFTVRYKMFSGVRRRVKKFANQLTTAGQ